MFRLQTSLLRFAWSAVALTAVLVVGAAEAQSARLNTSSGMTLAKAPLALRGYDPVAYFETGRPTLGSADFQLAHDGAAYRFASAAHRDSFKAAPVKYLPQYGGFCAFGVSVGAKFDGDPMVWKIVDGKLYLNLNPKIRESWEKDIPANIAKANKNWREIRDKSPAEL